MPTQPIANEKRVIRRYANRRLYDVGASNYVNLDDLRRLVIERVDFCVVIDKTGEDLTLSVLKHIFLDLELKGVPIFSEQALRNLIFMNNALPLNSLNTYLSYYFKMFESDSSL